MYWVVIHEGVLRHVVGSPEIMRAQLDRPHAGVGTTPLVEHADDIGVVGRRHVGDVGEDEQRPADSLPLLLRTVNGEVMSAGLPGFFV